MDTEGNFTETVHKDVKGVLSLNEASYLAFEGEDILNEALTFSRTHLNQLKTKLNPYMSELVSHSLELPRHYRMRRLEVRWYTEAYCKKDANCMLLEFAKLDFNRVESIYQEEIKNLTRSILTKYILLNKIVGVSLTISLTPYYFHNM